MTWIPFLLAAIVFLLAWYGEAPREAKLIAERIQHDIEEDLDHEPLLVRRVTILGLLTLFAWGFSGNGHTIHLNDVLLAPLYIAIAWASFTITHRYRLNTLRKMDWRYIAPWGNKYDRFWWRRGGERYIQSRIAIEAVEAPYRNGSEHWRKYVHRAGTLAYIFELFILALSLGVSIAILQ